MSTHLHTSPDHSLPSPSLSSAVSIHGHAPSPRHGHTRPGVGVGALGVLAALVALAGCGESTRLPEQADVGPRPTLVPPNKTLIPTVNIAPAVGWPNGRMPTPAAGLKVAPFAGALDHPRWLYVLPNGDVLVAESNAPPRPEEGKGFKAWVMQLTMKRAGAGVPSANRITLFRDGDGDGQAEQRTVFLEGLNSPFGMALVGDKLYVANTDGVMEYPYTSGATRITAPGRLVAPLPAGPRNHHWTKNIIASADGSKLYATVGSNSNVAENGMAAEENRAAILEITIASGATRVFASGLRNPNGMAWEPQTGTLWTVANERDEIGSDLVPDYLTSVRDGAFYGWPYSYYGQHVDARVQPQRPDLVARAVAPDYALGAHVAALGLVTSQGSNVAAAMTGTTASTSTVPSNTAATAASSMTAAQPASTAPTAVPAASGASATTSATATSPRTAAAPTGPQGMFIGLHGSWNRKPHSGYKVVYVAFDGGKPTGVPVDVLSGFVNDSGDAQGRPVGVAIDKRGGLLVADDVGNVVWRVTPR